MEPRLSQGGQVVNPLLKLSLIFVHLESQWGKQTWTLTTLPVPTTFYKPSFYFQHALSTFPLPWRLWKKNITLALNALTCLNSGDLGRVLFIPKEWKSQNESQVYYISSFLWSSHIWKLLKSSSLFSPSPTPLPLSLFFLPLTHYIYTPHTHTPES